MKFFDFIIIQYFQTNNEKAGLFRFWKNKKNATVYRIVLTFTWIRWVMRSQTCKGSNQNTTWTIDEAEGISASLPTVSRRMHSWPWYSYRYSVQWCLTRKATIPVPPQFFTRIHSYKSITQLQDDRLSYCIFQEIPWIYHFIIFRILIIKVINYR